MRLRLAERCDNRSVASVIRIGVDTGGTFTDLVLDPGGGAPLVTHKLLSTPAAPEQAVIAGVAQILYRWAAQAGPGAPPAGAPQVIHGSTVATNALLEGRGARVAFITSAGFEDTLFIGRQDRSELYALEPAKPLPPLRREDCIGVAERLACDGAALRELSAAEIERVVRRVRELGVEAVALSLLHCYASPLHEQRLARALREQLPQLHLTVASELLPEFREYERGMTCLINAAVAPRMAAYLGRLEAHLGADNLRVMASAGGTLPPREVLRAPVQTILSGPAGGVLGAQAQAGAAGLRRCITFDMGGTSTDVALIEGALELGWESEINGWPLRLPALAVHTVGAGGGSLAWVDAGGALRVGPQSAGADPGPACYGNQHGVLRATVTDAHTVLGHIPQNWPLAGSLRLDHAAAQAAVAQVAKQARLPLEQAAEGILRVAEAVMARAVQHISLQRGHDPRDYTLLPFGGAGGLHAARLAQQLGITRVLAPGLPGLLSALGMLCSAPLYTFSQALMLEVEPGQQPRLLHHAAVAQALGHLQALAQAALDRDSVPRELRQLRFSLDLRYRGQAFELNIPAGGGDTAQVFAARHRELYGYDAPQLALEVVAARIQASGTPSAPTMPPLAERSAAEPLDAVLSATRIFEDGQWTSAWQAGRSALLAGDVLAGPGIVCEYSATTLVPSGWRMAVNRHGQLLLEQQAGVGK
jgi:N-methylhydantoinase A